MYTLVDGVEFYDKDEIDTIVESITGGTIPNEDNIRTELTTKIDEEAEARTAADEALGTRIDSEATKRMDADALLSHLIAGEVESRVNADTAFANQLTAIEQLHTTLISPNGFIDSDGDAVNVNDSGKSIRQIAHEEFYRQLITDADDVKTQLDTLKELADYLQRNPSIITDMYNKLGITWSVDNPTDFGAFDFSTVLTATNVDDAVLELYNTFTDKIGDLAQLTTTFKDNIVGAVNELNAEIDTEVTARTDADTALGTRIDEEATARTDADTALGTRIDEEVTARTDADTALGTRIDEEVTARTDADTALGTRIDEEAAARTDADAALGTRIDEEVTARTDADTALGTRIDESIAESTALSTKIGDLTQLDTTSKDTIVSAINSEFEWRRKNDEALGTRIDEEVTARTDADTALGTRIDEEVGDLDSLKTTDKSSAVAAINELYDTVQHGGGGGGPVPTPSTGTPYIIEITTDTLVPPATIQGNLSPDVVASIQDAVTANKPLALKLMPADAPTEYMFIADYIYANNGYMFTSSTTVVRGQTLSITNFMVQVFPDKANYAGGAISNDVTIPEGGDTATNVYVLQLTYDAEFQPGVNVIVALTPEQKAAVIDAINNRVPIIAIVTSVSGVSSVLTPIETTSSDVGVVDGGVLSNTLMSLSGPGTPKATTITLNLDTYAGKARLKIEQAALGGGGGDTDAANQEENNDFLTKKMLLNMGKEIQPVVKAKYAGNASITTGEYIETRFVEDFSEMFSGCTALTSVPEYDTANAKDMGGMFRTCVALTSIPKLNTSSVTNMGEMFRDCFALTSIPEMDTSNVTDMSYMLADCTNLTSVPDLDTSNVTNMNSMFYKCTNLTSVPDLDTSNVTDMNAMFDRCTNLTSIPELDTSNVTDMSSMFTYCTALTSVPELDTSSVTNMDLMFNKCTALTSIPELDTSNVTDMNYMFFNCANLTSIPDLDTSNVAAMRSMFVGCTSLTTLRDSFYAPEGSRWQFKADVDFSPCSLDRTSILKVFNGLQTVTGKTIKISSTTNGYLSEEDKAIATAKGWVVQVV